MEIHQASESDIPVLIRLQQEWFDEGCVFGYMPDNLEQIKAALGPFFLIAESDDKIVGFISGSKHVSDGLAIVPKDVAYLEIDDIYISPQFRSTGIGGLLVDAVLEKAKQREFGYVLVYSATKDIHTVLKFYESHGFQSWYIQMFQNL